MLHRCFRIFFQFSSDIIGTVICNATNFLFTVTSQHANYIMTHTLLFLCFIININYCVYTYICLNYFLKLVATLASHLDL